MARENTILTGASGEYLTAAALCRRGWAASLTPHGYKGIDIVAVRDGTTILVQCKAAEANSSMWVSVDADAASVAAANAWCVLVSFTARPEVAADFYVVPLQVTYVFAWAGFANAVRRSEEKGKAPKRQGRGALKARDFGAYRDRWDLLEHPDPLGLPYAFTGGLWEWLDAVGPPPPETPAPKPGPLPPPAG